MIKTLTISELAKTRNMSYSTVRKYVNALIERGIIAPERTSHGFVLSPSDVEVFDTLVSFIRSGMPLKSAIERVAGGKAPHTNEVIQYLQRLEKRIEELEKENRALREIVQMYLSEVKGLPVPKKPWWKRIFGIK